MYHRNKHPISTVMFSNIHFETTNTEIFKCSTIDEVVNSTRTMKLLLLYKIIIILNANKNVSGESIISNFQIK